MVTASPASVPLMRAVEELLRLDELTRAEALAGLFPAALPWGPGLTAWRAALRGRGRSLQRGLASVPCLTLTERQYPAVQRRGSRRAPRAGEPSCTGRGARRGRVYTRSHARSPIYRIHNRISVILIIFALQIERSLYYIH